VPLGCRESDAARHGGLVSAVKKFSSDLLNLVNYFRGANIEHDVQENFLFYGVAGLWQEQIENRRYGMSADVKKCKMA